MTDYARDFALAIGNRNADLLRSLVTSAFEAGETVDPALLVLATSAACVDCVRVLLEHGIDVNSTDLEGNTALY